MDEKHDLNLFCTCGRKFRSFEACSPLGCSINFVCSGCFKESDSCICEPLLTQ